MHSKTRNFLQFYNSYWFIFWVLIYGILFYLSTLLINVINLKGYFLQILIIGTIISIFARAIHSNIRNYSFKLNFNLLIWTLTYILLLFGLNYLLSLFNFNIWMALFVVAIGLTLFIELIKKNIDFNVLATISIIVFIILILIILFGENTNVSNMFNKINNSGATSNDSSQSLTKDAILKDSIATCKENIKTELTAEKISAPVSFSYNLLEPETFNSVKEAEEYNSEYGTHARIFTDICLPLRDASSNEEPLLIGIIVIKKYSSPVMSYGTALEQESIVKFCNNKGRLVEVKFWCDS